MIACDRDCCLCQYGQPGNTYQRDGWDWPHGDEVVRHRCGETAHNVIHSERFAGYTPNWPAPIEDDDEESNTPRVPYQGRFA